LVCLHHIKQNNLTYLGWVCTPCLSVSTGIYGKRVQKMTSYRMSCDVDGKGSYLTSLSSRRLLDKLPEINRDHLRCEWLSILTILVPKNELLSFVSENIIFKEVFYPYCQRERRRKIAFPRDVFLVTNYPIQHFFIRRMATAIWGKFHQRFTSSI